MPLKRKDISGEKKEMNENTVSVIVPALNEENNVGDLVEILRTAVERHFDDYEIIIFNDGSTDRTGEVAEKIAAKNSHVRVVHNESPKCIGNAYKTGMKMARMHYFILINGKNDTTVESLERIFSMKGKYDLVIPYTMNIYERSATRLFFSRLFGWLLNKMFNLDLVYFNHYVLHKRELINSIPIHTDSYAFQAETIIKLIRKGCSYVEIGVMDVFKEGVKTKAFRLQNIIEVSRFFLMMLFYKAGFELKPKKL